MSEPLVNTEPAPYENPRRSPWRWIVALLVVVALCVGGYFVYTTFVSDEKEDTRESSVYGGVSDLDSGGAVLPQAPTPAQPPTVAEPDASPFGDDEATPVDPYQAELARAEAALDALTTEMGAGWESQLSAAVTFYCRVMSGQPSVDGNVVYFDYPYEDAALTVAYERYTASWRAGPPDNNWPMRFADAVGANCSMQAQEEPDMWDPYD